MVHVAMPMSHPCAGALYPISPRDHNGTGGAQSTPLSRTALEQWVWWGRKQEALRREALVVRAGGRNHLLRGRAYTPAGRAAPVESHAHTHPSKRRTLSPARHPVGEWGAPPLFSLV